MRKIIFFLLVVIVALLILIFLKLSDNLIFDYSRKAAQILETKRGLLPGAEIQTLNFAGAELESLNTIVWRDISSLFIVKRANNFLSGQNFTIVVNKLELILTNLFEKKFMLIANGLSISPSGQTTPIDGKTGKHQEGLEKGKLKIIFDFDFLSPGTVRTQICELLKKIGTIVLDGITIIPLDFSCISSFIINNELVRAMITTRRDSEGYYILVVNKEFFNTIAWLMADDLTDAETTVLSMNPFRTPKLLRIMNDAKKESEKYKENKGIPEDAYRHVLWSYLLSMEFGYAFSKYVTDAHEEGDNTNTEAEHQMDYNNNAVGRQYALNQYKRNEILERLLRDPKVIRSAQ
jgi:hypothetical protein